MLRGRLREQEQLRRHYGIAIPVLVRYDDYTVNIDENQIPTPSTRPRSRWFSKR